MVIQYIQDIEHIKKKKKQTLKSEEILAKLYKKHNVIFGKKKHQDSLDHDLILMKTRIGKAI